MERRALLRASDADREGVADRLRQAATEGRLSGDELEDRLSSAYSARTYGQLDTLLSDLPEPPSSPASPARRASRLPAWTRPALLLAVVAAVLSRLLHAAHQVTVAPGQHPGSIRTTTPPLGPGEVIHHLVVLAADTIGLIVLAVVVTVLLGRTVFRHMARSLSPYR